MKKEENEVERIYRLLASLVDAPDDELSKEFCGTTNGDKGFLLVEFKTYHPKTNEIIFAIRLWSNGTIEGLPIQSKCVFWFMNHYMIGKTKEMLIAKLAHKGPESLPPPQSHS